MYLYNNRIFPQHGVMKLEDFQEDASTPKGKVSTISHSWCRYPARIYSWCTKGETSRRYGACEREYCGEHEVHPLKEERIRALM